MSQSLTPPDEARHSNPAQPSPLAPEAEAPPRLRRPERQQLLVQPRTVDDLVPHDHPVRTIWALVQRWDLTRFLEVIRARGTRPGRKATDPQLLIALWLYAAADNVGCGRRLNRLCTEADPYKWLCGGVSLNYHTLNDFRVDHGAALDDLLVQMIAVLTRAGIVSIERIAQDGTRIRASAGSSSFHRRATLEEGLEAARAHLEAVKRDAADPALSARQRAARARAARERQGRLEEALAELAEVERAKAGQKDKPSKGRQPRASSTDPVARLMRMADGGTRPAYNLELATDCSSRAIVGVEMTNAGSDVGQDGPMRAQVEGRANAAAEDREDRAYEAIDEQLLDGNYVSLEGIERAAAEGVELSMPVPKPRSPGVDPHAPKRTDSEAVAEWRRRMGTEPAQEVYRQRGSTIETINGELKTFRGLSRLLVRGLAKARCMALWSALAYNVVHFGPFLLDG